MQKLLKTYPLTSDDVVPSKRIHYEMSAVIWPRIRSPVAHRVPAVSYKIVIISRTRAIRLRDCGDERTVMKR